MIFIVINQDTENALDIYIKPGKTVNLASNGQTDLIGDEGLTRDEIAKSDVPYHIEEGNIIVNNGNEDLTKLIALRIAFNAPNSDFEQRTTTGVLRVQPTPRPIIEDATLKTYFTGRGDDASDVIDVGGGELFQFIHDVGDSLNQVAYMDFNCAENLTWINEGLLTFKGAVLDRIRLDMVPITTGFEFSGVGTVSFTGSGLDDMTAGSSFTGSTSKDFVVEIDAEGTTDTFRWSNDGGDTWEATDVAITGSDQTLEESMTVNFGAVTGHSLGDEWNWRAVTSDTDYKLYNSYLIVPDSFPVGDQIDLTVDLTDPNGGLVYAPNNDKGESPSAYWNADYNTTTHEFENITAAPTGNGRYNLFGVEVVFVTFVNDIAMLGTDDIELKSHDVDQVGHGVRLKATVITVGTDHDWKCCAFITLFRERTI